MQKNREKKQKYLESEIKKFKDDLGNKKSIKT